MIDGCEKKEKEGSKEEIVKIEISLIDLRPDSFVVIEFECLLIEIDGLLKLSNSLSDDNWNFQTF